MGKTRHCYILYGPTASGKSALAETVAGHAPICIINADSKQVLRDIPILTAQPCPVTRQTYPHALYGHVSLHIAYAVREWLSDIAEAFAACEAQGLVPCCVGGTGMYARALTDGISPVPPLPTDIELGIRDEVNAIGAPAAHDALKKIDPLSAERLGPNDAPRIAKALSVYEATGETLSVWRTRPNVRVLPDGYKATLFKLERPREMLYDNAERRFDMMIENGVIDEVRACLPLISSNPGAAGKAHGLPELSAYIRDEMSLDEARRVAVRNTRHYIKRQFTWMRHRMPEAVTLWHEHNSVNADVILKTMKEQGAL